MTENMKNFLAKVSEDKALAEKFSQLDKAELIAAAKELGFDLTEADFAQPEGSLSDDELGAVAGGGNCLCVVGGGGTRDKNSKACGCVAYGLGRYNNKARRCECMLGGAGNHGNH